MLDEADGFKGEHEINLPNCKVMHLGRIKESSKHSLNGTELVSIRKKKDLGFAKS